MATITAHSGLDMREMIFLGEIVTATADRITIRYGDRASVLDGAFSYDPLGLARGTMFGFSLRVDGATVFEATGVERSAYTAVGIARTGDNDRFLAYTLSGSDRLNGTAGVDYLLGFGGDDAVLGGGGDDSLFGGSGDDRLYGGSGDDLLASGDGVDLLYGGAGDDTYVIEDARERVSEAGGAGWDIVLASASYVLTDNVDELGLTGARDLNGRGNDAANVVRGNNGANVLRGMGGDDALSGLGGDDLLIGGGGRDLLSGGYGDDVYRFVSVADSSSARRDKILEFWSGQDVIDLAAIDANEGRAGKQGFVFIEDAAFSGRAGELRVSTGQVSADVDGDRRADLIIDVHERLLLERADFIL